MQRQVILNALITIWDSEQEAPISCHPERNNITLANRKRDWDQIEQCLMPEYSHADVIKNDFGQPSLLDGKFLSISHSDRFAATAISIEPVGIDIQVPRTTIFKVRHKFCHPNELQFLSNHDEDQRYHMIWCAKEAIFKIYGFGIDFSRDLFCYSFDAHTQRIEYHQQSPNHKKAILEVEFIKKHHYFVAIAKIKKT